jgi:hypothetical protein
MDRKTATRSATMTASLTVDIAPTHAIGVRGARRLLAEFVRASLIFMAATCAGVVILVALFRLGVAGSIDILFYRGILLCAFAFVLTLALVAWVGHQSGRISLREAVACGFLSLGVNLSVLVIAPVTLDRSVSIFILGHMAAHPGESFTTQDIETALRDGYFGRLRQVERRMNEQLRTGNVVRAGDTYTISPQGLGFVASARRIGALFGVDPRLIGAGDATPPAGTRGDTGR